MNESGIHLAQITSTTTTKPITTPSHPQTYMKRRRPPSTIRTLRRCDYANLYLFISLTHAPDAFFLFLVAFVVPLKSFCCVYKINSTYIFLTDRGVCALRSYYTIAVSLVFGRQRLLWGARKLCGFQHARVGHPYISTYCLCLALPALISTSRLAALLLLSFFVSHRFSSVTIRHAFVTIAINTRVLQTHV